MYLFYYPVNASTAQELLLPVPDTYKLFFYTAQLLWYLQSGFFHLRSLFAFMLVSERAQEPQPIMWDQLHREHVCSRCETSPPLVPGLDFSSLRCLWLLENF